MYQTDNTNKIRNVAMKKNGIYDSFFIIIINSDDDDEKITHSINN